MARRRARIPLYFVVIFIIFYLWVTSKPKTDIIIYAPNSMKRPLKEIGRIFQNQNNKFNIRYKFDSSDNLLTQITGDPRDLFISDNPKNIKILADKNMLLPDTQYDIGYNTLVMVTPSDSQIKLKTYEDLKKPQIKKISIYNSLTDTAGKCVEKTLKQFNLLNVLEQKFIFGTNEKQVLRNVTKKEAEAGIVYATDAYLMKDDLNIIYPPLSYSSVNIHYTITALSDTKDQNAANDMVTVFMSPEGKDILEKYGLLTK